MLGACFIKDGHHAGRFVRQFVGGRLRRDDLRARDEFVAVAVIAVRMRVDELIDAHARRGAFHRGEHLGGEPHVEQRIDQQRPIRHR